MVSNSTSQTLIQSRFGQAKDEPAAFASQCKKQISQSVRGSYEWAVGVFLHSWALEQLDEFGAAAKVMEELVNATNSAESLEVTTGTVVGKEGENGSNERTQLPPLSNPHPLHPSNKAILESRLEMLLKLHQSAISAEDQAAPAILGRDSKQRLLYRLQLRGAGIPRAVAKDYAWSVSLMLSSDMGLFRSVDFEGCDNIIVQCKIVTLDGSAPAVTIEDMSIESLLILDRKGKGFVHVCLQTAPQTKQVIYLSFSATNNEFVLPLIIGPIHLLPETEPYNEDNEELVAPDITRPIHVVSPKPQLLHDKNKTVESIVYISETSDSGIHGRVWDSAVVLSHALPLLISSLASKTMTTSAITSEKKLRVMDIGCGVGIAGLVFGSLISSKVIMTDLPDCLKLPAINTALNKHVIDSTGSIVEVSPLTWGDVAGTRSFGTFDVIIAADVVYETEYFDDLLVSLDLLATDETELWLVYKKRGLSQEEESKFFRDIGEIFVLVKEDEKVLSSVADEIGCYLHRFKKRQC
ncbi:putative methyltransferase-domain-containing protein [Chytriomyces sp. MP71]|nr:putative methyltransferase-domain-containing protein [Chytriomyces sp. MP71]